MMHGGLGLKRRVQSQAPTPLQRWPCWELVCDTNSHPSRVVCPHMTGGPHRQTPGVMGQA